MTQFDYSKFSDKKLHQLYTTFSFMKDQKKHQGNPAIGIVKDGLLQELKRRGLRNEADEKSNAMRKQFVEDKDGKPVPMSQVKKICPWAAYFKRAGNGVWCFEGRNDYLTFKENEADENKCNDSGAYQDLTKKRLSLLDEVQLLSDKNAEREREIRRLQKSTAGLPQGAEGRQKTKEVIKEIEKLDTEIKRDRETEKQKQKEITAILSKIYKIDREKSNEADENKCNAGEKQFSDKDKARVKRWLEIQKIWADGKNEDLPDHQQQTLKREASGIRDMYEWSEWDALVAAHKKGFRNSKENAMDKTSAIKKKILLSNASDAVKAKAIKKVMENDFSSDYNNASNDLNAALIKMRRVLEKYKNDPSVKEQLDELNEFFRTFSQWD